MAILHGKQGLVCGNFFYQTRPKNVIKLAKGSLNNIFQDSFTKISSHQLTCDRSYICVILPRTNFEKAFSALKFNDSTSKLDSPLSFSVILNDLSYFE